MTRPQAQDVSKSTRLSAEQTRCVTPVPAIGLIVLATDPTIEREFRSLMPLDQIALYHSRIHNDSQITPETLATMDTRITECASLLVPGMPLDVVAYGCTCASVLMGDEAVFERIHAARPDVDCTSPATAALAALKALGISRMALLTPYRHDITQAVRGYFRERGLEVPLMGYFDQQDDGLVARIRKASILSAAIELGSHDHVDAVFISCTTLRASGIVTEIEAALDKPVTTSTHALAWHCLRLAGVDARSPELGRLFTHSLA
jgi:maleate isomerase